MTRINKLGKVSMVLAAMLLAAGCVIEPDTADESKEEAADDSQETAAPSSNWAEGLTVKEAVESMPAWIEAAGLDASAEPLVQNGIATSTHALGCYNKPKVSYCLPKQINFTDVGNWTWNIWIKNIWTDSWVQIFPIIRKELVEEEYTFSFEDDPLAPNQTVRYYKIETIDDHNGEPYSTVVSFVVAPNANPIRVTLSDETNAAATSDLYLNGEELWADLNAQDKPQTQTLVEGTVSPCIPINFQIQTDFSGWDFGPYEFPHTSNSTFCKVSVEDPPSDDVAQRFKYEFEDLPISQVKVEADHKFDYDDVIIYVDLLNTTN